MSQVQIDSVEALRKYTPQCPVFVISIDKFVKPSGMIAAWNMKCSYEPPMFEVCLSKEGYTHKLIQESKEFVIAIPHLGMKESVEFFGSTHGDKVDKFTETEIATEKAKIVRSPLLKDAILNYECKLAKEVEVGDHIMFIGEIVASHYNPTAGNGKGMLFSVGKKDGKRIFAEFKEGKFL